MKKVMLVLSILVMAMSYNYAEAITTTVVLQDDGFSINDVKLTFGMSGSEVQALLGTPSQIIFGGHPSFDEEIYEYDHLAVDIHLGVWSNDEWRARTLSGISILLAKENTHQHEVWLGKEVFRLGEKYSQALKTVTKLKARVIKKRSGDTHRMVRLANDNYLSIGKAIYGAPDKDELRVISYRSNIYEDLYETENYLKNMYTE